MESVGLVQAQHELTATQLSEEHGVGVVPRQPQTQAQHCMEGVRTRRVGYVIHTRPGDRERSYVLTNTDSNMVRKINDRTINPYAAGG